MAGSSYFVLDLPSSKNRLCLLVVGWGCGTGELSAVGTLVVAIIALPAVAARLATAAWQFLVTLYLEAMAAQAAQAIALALTDNAQLICRRPGGRGTFNRHAIGINGPNTSVRLGALSRCGGRD